MVSMITNNKLLTESDFDAWVSEFHSRNLCDGSFSLLLKTTFARIGIDEYADNQNEIVKRTFFVLMCHFPVHEKKFQDDTIGFTYYFAR